MAGRRTKGEGSISHLQEGSWRAYLTLEGGRRKDFYAKKKQEVRRRLTTAVRDANRGLTAAYDERLTVAHYLATWLDAVKAGGVKPRGWTRYESDVRLHLVPAIGIGSMRLARPCAAHLQHLYAQDLDAGFKSATVAHVHAVTHAALEHAMRHNIIPRNVADLVKAPRPATCDMHILDKAQVNQLLATAAAADGRLQAIYLLATRTGMRLGELLALTWADVDLDGRFLQVRHTLHHPQAGGWTITTPKTEKSRRRIDLAPSVMESLRAHRVRQHVERLAAGSAWRDRDFVFCRQDGEPLRGTHVYQRQFLPPLQRAQLPAIRFHDLRHTCASLLLVAGVTIKAVSELLGHSSVAITWDRYSHVVPSLQRDAAMALESLFERA